MSLAEKKKEKEWFFLFDEAKYWTFHNTIVIYDFHIWDMRSAMMTALATD